MINFAETVLNTTSAIIPNTEEVYFTEAEEAYGDDYSHIDLYYEGVLTIEAVEATTVNMGKAVNRFVSDNADKLDTVTLIGEAAGGEKGFFGKAIDKIVEYWNIAIKWISSMFGRLVKSTGVVLNDAKKNSLAFVDKAKGASPAIAEGAKYDFVDVAKWYPKDAVNLAINTFWNQTVINSMSVNNGDKVLTLDKLLNELLPEALKAVAAGNDTDILTTLNNVYDDMGEYIGLENKEEKAKYFMTHLLDMGDSAFKTIVLSGDFNKDKTITDVLKDQIINCNNKKTYAGQTDVKNLFDELVTKLTEFSSLPVEDAKKVVNESGKALKAMVAKYNAIPKTVKSATKDLSKTKGEGDHETAAQDFAKSLTEMSTKVTTIISYMTSNIMIAYRSGEVCIDETVKLVNSGIKIGNNIIGKTEPAPAAETK